MTDPAEIEGLGEAHGGAFVRLLQALTRLHPGQSWGAVEPAPARKAHFGVAREGMSAAGQTRAR